MCVEKLKSCEDLDSSKCSNRDDCYSVKDVCNSCPNSCDGYSEYFCNKDPCGLNCKVTDDGTCIGANDEPSTENSESTTTSCEGLNVALCNPLSNCYYDSMVQKKCVDCPRECSDFGDSEYLCGNDKYCGLNCKYEYGWCVNVEIQ